MPLGAVRCCPHVTGGIRAMRGAISYIAQGSSGLGDVLGATWSGIGLSWMPLEPIREGLGDLLGCSWSPLPPPPALE